MSFLRVLQQRSRCLTLVNRRYASSTPSNATADAAGVARKSGSAPVSSCPVDTKLEGLNYLKGQAPVLALPDDQYPEWLWTVLQPKVYADDGPGGKAERVRRRAENKQRIKDRNFMQTQ